nr:hypothetical protein Iba_chr01aCG3270 [Ipomoea batatas]
MSTRKTGEEHRIHGLAEDCNRGDCETEGDDESFKKKCDYTR